MSKSIVSPEEQIYKKWAVHLDTLSEKDKDGDKWVETRNAEKVLLEALSQFKESQATELANPDYVEQNGERYIREDYTICKFFPEFLAKLLREGRLKIIEGNKDYFSECLGKPITIIDEFIPENNQQQPTEVERMKDLDVFNLAETFANLSHEDFDGNEDLHYKNGFILGYDFGYKAKPNTQADEDVERYRSAWPLNDILKRLITAAEILLHKKDYDGPDYEEIALCVKLAKRLSTQPTPKEEDVEKMLSDLMIYVNDEAQRVAKTLNLDDHGKDLLHENMDMAFSEWKRKNLAGYNAAKTTK